MRSAILLVPLAALCACSIPEKHLVDGGQGPFECLNKPLPSTAPAQITITGAVSDPFTGAKLPGASIEGYLVGVATPLFQVTVDGDGNYSRAQGTGNVPRNAYLHGTQNGFVDTYVYPAVPVATDVRQDVVLFTQMDLATLAMVGEVTLDPSQALVIVSVVDCNGVPVGGATVSTTPPGTVVYFVQQTPSPSAVATDSLSGLALIANIAPGNTMVSATVDGMTLRAHDFDTTPGTLLQTAIQP